MRITWNGFWAWFGKLAAICSVIGFVVLVWPWGDEEVGLRGRLSYSSFSLPLGVYRFRQPGFLIDQDEIDATVGPGDKATELADSLTKSATKSANSRFSRLVELQGYWYGTLWNDGTLPATGVKLVVPDAVSAWKAQTRDSYLIGDIDQADESIHGALTINEIRPGDHVSVRVWTRSEPSQGIATAVTLTHDGGEGELTFDAPTGPWGVWLRRAVLTSGWIFGLALALVSAVRLTGLSAHSRKARDSPS